MKNEDFNLFKKGNCIVLVSINDDSICMAPFKFNTCNALDHSLILPCVDDYDMIISMFNNPFVYIYFNYYINNKLYYLTARAKTVLSSTGFSAPNSLNIGPNNIYQVKIYVQSISKGKGNL